MKKLIPLLMIICLLLPSCQLKKPHIADETHVIVDKIVKIVNKASPKSNTDMIYVAYRLAKAAHRDQFRKSGEPYIIHPVQIAYIAAELSPGLASLHLIAMAFPFVVL